MKLQRFALLLTLFTFLPNLPFVLGDALGKETKKLFSPSAPKQPAEPAKPAAHTVRNIEGWKVLVDDRLLVSPNEKTGERALRFLAAKLADIKTVVPEDRLKKLQAVTIVLDLTHGKLGPMQYHPSAGWLKANGYSTELAKCVHLPRAIDLPTRRNIVEQPWVILHELAHAYHDQVLGFDEPRIREAYEKFKKSGHGDKVLASSGRRTRHYALTNRMEFFAEMTESYFGVNDFFPFNRAELKEAEPEIYTLLHDIWEAPRTKQSAETNPTLPQQCAKDNPGQDGTSNRSMTSWFQTQPGVTQTPRFRISQTRGNWDRRAPNPSSLSSHRRNRRGKSWPASVCPALEGHSATA
jgi:hypothetical protein